MMNTRVSVEPDERSLEKLEEKGWNLCAPETRGMQRAQLAETVAPIAHSRYYQNPSVRRVISDRSSLEIVSAHHLRWA